MSVRSCIQSCVAILAVYGCGDDAERPAGEPSEQVEQPAEQTRSAGTEAAAAAPESEVDPCSIFTEAMVRRELGLGDDVVVENVPPSERSRDRLCTYRWPNPDFDPQAHARRVMERMRKSGTSEGVEEGVASSRAQHEVTYTYGGSFDDVERASRAFQSRMATADRGVTRRIERGAAKGTDVSFRVPQQPVEGIGDEASWNERWTQLAVRSGTEMFHVRAAVEEDAAANLALAKKLATAIIAEM
jgi:hypothetical protein